MATKIQLQALVNKVLELQYNGESVHSVTFESYFLLIHTARGLKVEIDTDGKDKYHEPK